MFMWMMLSVQLTEHIAPTSVYTQYVKTAAVGYLMQKEIDFLGNAVNNPARPFVAILGGSKVSSKISVINNLLDKVDTLIIGVRYGLYIYEARGR